jgi:hypothetical protein
MRELIKEVAMDMAAHGIGVFGTDDPADRTIFWGEMPDGVTKGVLLVQPPGPPPEKYIDTEKLILDIWVKNPSTDLAYEKMRDIYNLYNRRYHWTTDSWHVYWSIALGSIVDADRNREGSKLLRLSLQFMCRNLSNIS